MTQTNALPVAATGTDVRAPATAEPERIVPGPTAAAGGHEPEEPTMAKTWTSGAPAQGVQSQPSLQQVVETRGSSIAEGMGFEPTTPCGAPDFESGRWPIRLPSSDG